LIRTSAPEKDLSSVVKNASTYMEENFETHGQLVVGVFPPILRQPMLEIEARNRASR